MERLANWSGNARFRERLLRRESTEVLARVAALEGHLNVAAAMLRTEGPDTAMGVPGPPPERIGPFAVEAQIGEGGMGVVYRARRIDGLYDQTVAIKLIHPHLRARAGAAFDAERRILARLEHPNIARLIDGGMAEGNRPYLIMEYVDGRPLDEAAEGLPLASRVRLFLQAAAAVAFAHGRLVAHADLKPGNVLVDTDGRVKLLDFGIARLLDDRTIGATEPSPMTRRFASPQRLAGESPSIADDIHALGVTLGLISGAEADPDLAAIASKAQARDPGQRYASVPALIDDLERWLDHRPVSARADRLGYRMAKLIQRRPRLAAATGLALVLLSLAGTVAKVNLDRARREHAEAAARFQDARGVANYLLSDLMGRLENQPRSLALRVDVARRAQQELDRLAAAKGADASLKLEVATGLWRLAGGQASPDRPNLNQPDAARANLRRAAEIAESLTSPAARSLLTRIRIDQTGLATSFDNDTAAGENFLAQAKTLLAAAPDAELSLQAGLAEARLRGWQGRYADEAAVAARTLAAAPETNDKARIKLRAALSENEAEGDYYLGRLKKAEAGYRAQVDALTGAKARWPADASLVGLLASARWNLATTLAQERRFVEAAPILAQARIEGQSAVDFDPADAAARRQFRIIDNAYAQNLAFRGRSDEALTILRGHAAADAEAWRAHPNEPLRLHDYALSMTMVGEALANAGRAAESCEVDGRALELFTRLQGMGRLTQWDLGYNISNLQGVRARTCGRPPPR